MSILSLRSVMEHPDPYLSGLAESRLRDFSKAQTPEEKERSTVDCLNLAKLIRNSIHPLVKSTHPERADAVWKLAERLFDAGRPWAQARLQVDYREPDRSQLILDQLENLTLAMHSLKVEMTEHRSLPVPRKTFLLKGVL